MNEWEWSPKTCQRFFPSSGEGRKEPCKTWRQTSVTLTPFHLELGQGMRQGGIYKRRFFVVQFL